MIKLIIPTHCIFCKTKLSNGYCPNRISHIPSDMWAHDNTNAVNIILNNGYQFSFQRHKTFIISPLPERRWLHEFEPPWQVELDPIKLEQKLKTILIFS